jgi:ActR/RegA family two-component response regulator
VAQVVATLQDLGTPRGEGEAEAVLLDRAVAEALELVRPELTANGRPSPELSVDLSSEAVVRARHADVRELAVHLLLAALDHAPASTRIRLSTERHGPVARLSLETATPFTELDALEPVRELATTWHGEVRSEAGRVLVELPGAPEPVTTKAPVPTAVERARTVLVVDDDDDNRQALAQILGAEGFEVVEAHSAAEAEAAARTRPFEVALVDLVMPDGSGWDVVKRLAELHPDARLALVTGAAGAIAAEPGAGVDVVFAKPIDVEALLGFLGRRDRASVPGTSDGRH